MSGKCLQCLRELAKMAVAKEEGQKADDSEFDITGIPGVMDSLKGVQGPRFMRRWFNATAYELPMKMKMGELDARTLSRAQLLEDLPFSWLESSTRVGPIVKETLESLSEINEFNALVGKTKGVLDQLSRGLIVLMGRLETLGLLDAKKKRLVNGSRFFRGSARHRTRPYDAVQSYSFQQGQEPLAVVPPPALLRVKAMTRACS
jgi:hypothetical protein